MSAEELTMEQRMENVEKKLDSLVQDFQQFLTAKKTSTKTRVKESVAGNKTVKVSLDVNATKATKAKKGATKTEAAASSSTAAKTAKNPPNIHNWFIGKYADGLRDSFLKALDVTQATLNEKYKKSLEDPKHVAKTEVNQLKAEARWVYRDYIKEKTEASDTITKMRQKIDSGEFSDNKVEENSTEE